jgi:hypothetical protein
MDKKTRPLTADEVALLYERLELSRGECPEVPDTHLPDDDEPPGDLLGLVLSDNTASGSPGGGYAQLA